MGTSEVPLQYEIGLNQTECESIEGCSEYCYSCESTSGFVNGVCFNDQIDEISCGNLSNSNYFISTT